MRLIFLEGLQQSSEILLESRLILKMLRDFEIFHSCAKPFNFRAKKYDIRVLEELFFGSILNHFLLSLVLDWPQNDYLNVDWKVFFSIKEEYELNTPAQFEEES